MKKLALVLCLLAVSFTAQAQFEKGTKANFFINLFF